MRARGCDEAGAFVQLQEACRQKAVAVRGLWAKAELTEARGLETQEDAGRKQFSRVVYSDECLGFRKNLDKNYEFLRENVMTTWRLPAAQRETDAKKPPAMPAESDAPPPGRVFIDTAVCQIKERLRISEGPAVKRLLDALRGEGIRSWMNRFSGRTKLPSASWNDADVDLDCFRNTGQSGIRFGGTNYHLHYFLIAEDDLGCWLGGLAPSSTANATKGAASAPADVAAAAHLPTRTGTTMEPFVPRPQHGDQADTLSKRRKSGHNPRGPRPEKREAIARRMIHDYADNPEALLREKQETLRNTYSVSRDTADKARKDALRELQRVPSENSGK
jgi:hypothetical protein